MWTFKSYRNDKQAKQNKNSCAQVTLEFVLGMIVVLLTIYGSVMIFRWAGVGLVERRMAHDITLTNSIQEGWGGRVIVTKDGQTITIPVGDGPLQQIDPQFYKMKKMCAVFGECF